MNDGFDPYYEWLGIPRHDQPPNWYRLLGIELFEANSNVIARAADRQMGHLRTFQSGPHARESQRLLNEVSAARIGLLSPPRKEEYDQKLRVTMEFPAFEATPSDPILPPTVASILPPAQAPPAFVVNSGAMPPTVPSASVAPIPASVRTRRRRRRREPFWAMPAFWALVMLLLIFAALLGFALILIQRGNFSRRSATPVGVSRIPGPDASGPI